MLLGPKVQSKPPDPGTELSTSAMVRPSKEKADHLLADMAVERIKVRKARARVSEDLGRERLLGPEKSPSEAKPLKEGTSLMITYKPSVI